MESGNYTKTAEWATATTEQPLTPEEEDAIVMMVIVIVAVLAIIILLFSMGIFIDCRTQKDDPTNCTSSGSINRKRMRLKMPPLGRARRQGFGKQRLDDSRYLASDMCPSGNSIVGGLDAVV